MAIVKAKKDKRVLLIESHLDVKRNAEKYFFRIKIILFFMTISIFFSPIIWLMLLIYSLFFFHRYIYHRYFENEVLFKYYLDMFSCPTADNGVHVFTKFGYKIDIDEEWDLHYARLKGYTLPEDLNVSDTEVKKLADTLAKEAQRVKRTQKYREVGYGKDLATRHILFIGTTGAGKTESLMTWFDDITAKENSGGIIMIDGKGDAKMHSKISSMLEKNGRVTSSYAVNFLKQEKMSTTNTYNSVLTMSPYKGVSFMGSLLPSSEGGNGDYFKNRGIAMLTIPLSALKIRNEFYAEPFSLSLLQDSASTLNISIIFALFYGFVRETNDEIKENIENGNKKAKRLWDIAKNKTTAVNQDVEYYEKLLNYVTQYKPSAKAEVEALIGFDFKLFHMSYNMVFKLARAYMNEIFAEWSDMSNAVAEALYVYIKEEKKKTFSVNSSDPVKLEDIRKYFTEINNEAVVTKIIDSRMFQKTQKKTNDLKMALAMTENAKASLYKLPDNAVQQHAYSQQQWTNLFNTFDRFPHIFGSPFPDVDMKDIIKNNKVLYALNPILEIGQEMGELLGKMLIRDMQESGSVALGGENLTLTPRQRTLYTDKITPKPLSMMVADEYGYYRVEGVMQSILAQFRSLNFSVVLSLQEVAGLGKDEETKKTLANTSKFVLKSYDEDIKKFVDEAIKDVEVIEKDKYINAHGEVEEEWGSNIKINKEKALDSSILSDLNYGCGVLISNAKPMIVQSYYFGGVEAVPYVASMEKYELVG